MKIQDIQKRQTPVTTDENLLEQIPYPEDTLPISYFYDDFDNFTILSMMNSTTTGMMISSWVLS